MVDRDIKKKKKKTLWPKLFHHDLLRLSDEPLLQAPDLQYSSPVGQLVSRGWSAFRVMLDASTMVLWTPPNKNHAWGDITIWLFNIAMENPPIFNR